MRSLICGAIVMATFAQLHAIQPDPLNGASTTQENNNGHLLLEWKSMTWSVNGWRNEFRRLYTYNASEQSTEVIRQQWTASQIWLNTNRSTYEYNANGDTAVVTQFTYQGQWIGQARFTYSYSGSRLDSYLEESWNGSAWETFALREFSYIGGGSLVREDLRKRWNNNHWVNLSRIEYFYNVSNVSEELRQVWADTGWVYDRLTTYSYVPNGPSDVIVQLWVNNQWENYRRQNNIYNSVGQLFQYVTAFWNQAQWVNSIRATHDYTNGNLTETVTELWGSQGWVNSTRFTTIFNALNDPLESLSEQWAGSTWANIRLYVYTYGDPTSVVSSAETSDDYKLIGNYPNPFNPRTSIRFRIPEEVHVTLTVYDVLGREAATLVNRQMSRGTYDVPFETLGLSSGVYISRLQAGRFVETATMLLMK